MGPANEAARSTFESWSEPRNFLRRAWQVGASIPLQKALPQHLRDAYVAGLFATIWNDHSGCQVRLVPVSEGFPDAQLKGQNSALELEITVADQRDRRMFAEHAEWPKTGLPEHFPDRITREAYAREAIPRVTGEKARHYLGEPLSGRLVHADLLIYVNQGAVLAADEMAQLTAPWRENFRSIWLLAGADSVCAWPKRKVLSAVRDPLGD